MKKVTRREFVRTGFTGAMSLGALGTTSVHSRHLFAAGGDYSDAVLVDGPPPLPAPGTQTIVVLPDTQMYCERNPEGFLAQTKWIVDQKADRNITAALHLGDITNRNTPEQWDVAVEAIRQLDGEVPYVLNLGNHDYSEGGRATDRTTRFNDYFPLSDYRDLSTFGGVYDREPELLNNSYHRFELGDQRLLVLALEFGPRNDVIRWANEVLQAHPDHKVILTTHAYMYFDETRYDWQKYGTDQRWNPHSYGVAKTSDGDVNDGEELWTKLVAKNENVILTLNGHVLNDGLAHLESQHPSGGDVHQVLVNFQEKPNGGDGWLRLLEFSPDGHSVQTCDYSMTLDKRNESPANRFLMKWS